MITAKDIVRGLEPLRLTLKTLSIGTQSLGDDDGFPSLKRFEALEHLQVGAFDLAEYEEDDEEESDSDTDDEAPLHIEPPMALEDIPDDDGDEEYEDVDSDADTDETSNSDDTDDSTDSGDDTCKPVLHLFPSTLKTLYIDNLDDLDGGLNEELMKLAKNHKEDFPNFQKLTVETIDENSPEITLLRNAYKKAGLEFEASKVGWSTKFCLGTLEDCG